MKFSASALLILLSLASSASAGWGFGDWVSLGTCVTQPALCPVVYAAKDSKVVKNAAEAMKINLGFAEKQACGNLGDKLSESTATNLFVPDYFPPDETASKLFVDQLIRAGTGIPGVASSMDACIAEGTARLYHACEEHDYCMENRLYYSGDECDKRLLDSWEAKCRDTYASYSPCRAACLGVVNASWKVMATQTSDFMATSKKVITPAILSPLLMN